MVVLPDNDEPGQKHAASVANQLTVRGCRVRVLELPGLPEKGDVSDWLAAGGTKDELLALAEAAPEWGPDQNNQGALNPTVYDEWTDLLAETGRYSVDSRGYLCFEKFSERGGAESIPIANFLARPIREVSRDDGREVQLTFEIGGILTGGRCLPAVSVPAKDFAAMHWVSSSWGLGANIEPGIGAKEKVRHAIQSLASDVPRETIYTHLGWRQIGGKWVYLHAGGAVGAEGIRCEPGEGLIRYILPDTADPDAAKRSLRLLGVAPQEVTIPLFSLMFLAPLCEPLRRAGCEPAFVLWLAGQTGAMKSTLAALFISHFGEFPDKTALPGSFKDTENSLEKRGFLAKDTVFVVDDFHPVASPVDARKMLKTAQGILRAYGDRKGRTRMKADTSIREGFPPRGLCLVTGEDLPDGGQSTTARYLTVELQRGAADLELLTECQANAAMLAQAMRGYVEWLAPRLDGIPEKLRKRFEECREEAMADEQHGRIPEVVAWLLLGFHSGLDFAVHTKALTRTEFWKMFFV